jgi:hypothetical protein
VRLPAKRPAFLDAFAKLRKAAQLRRVCLSVRVEQNGFHWMDFHEICCLSIFGKSVEKIQASLKPDSKDRRFT